MDFDVTKIGDALGEGIQELGDTIEEKTASFHENFVSKVVPVDGKYGEAATFAAEMMIPGVSEYNAIREGDWQRLATEVAIGAAVTVGIATIGVGVTAAASAGIVGAVGIKAVSEVAEVAVKAVAKEGGQIVAKAAVREGAEAAGEKALKEGSEMLAKSTIKESGETITTQVTKETSEVVGKKVDDVIRDGTHLENGKLRADVTYKSGEHDYIYQTDSKGRIIGAQAESLQLKKHEGRLKHSSNSLGKLESDDAGHLIGDRFGGSQKLDNIVSQHRLVNQKEFKAIEDEWADAIKSGKTVSVEQKINYDKNDIRPSSFDIYYEIDGMPFFKTLDNIQ